ncbi:MAG TPA: MOSC N-terminal beta barrel domain-containing protein [Gaiellaceae bacterium]|nr:MOSC N-terminal beta barrel domain-containing protein [Gaiellaceae bacterium]
MEGRVVRISIAPVKALHLVNPDEVELTHAGVAGDRRFWLVDADRRLVNGKRHPELMCVQPEWDEDSRRLVLEFPDGSIVDGEVEPGESFAAELYGTPHPSRVVPGPWQEALSEFAGEPMTLLWSEGGAQDRGNDRAGWASLISRGSLERMRAEAGRAAPVDGRRFRMLFEIDGVEAHEEDRWLGRRVAIGDAVIVPVGDVGRCAVTTCDPDTAVSDFDTLKLLAGYRREGVTEPLPFGVYCDVAVAGRVRVGDPVNAVERDPVAT